jgi:hypothetical protein
VLPTSQPALEFQGYSKSPTNEDRFATFLLRNTTRKTMWLIKGGREFPLSPPFRERPDISTWPTNILVSLGSYFMSGERLPPGKSLPIEFKLQPGKPPKQIGIYYFFGNYKDGNDVIEATTIYYYVPSNNLWEKIKNFLWTTKHRWQAPKSRQVWCLEWVSLDKAKTTNLLGTPTH